jgi:hypothetical protein
MVKIADLEGMMANQTAQAVSAKTATGAIPSTPAQNNSTAVAAAVPLNVPVPTENPLAFAPVEPQETADAAAKKPFWKFWVKD